jgi:single-strand DNA-binding protein
VNDLNSVILIGRLTRDAELKYTAGGTAVCNFSVAVNRSVKKDDAWTDEANFFDVTIFGKQGESVNKFLTKGKQISVIGELKQDRWEQEGKARSKVHVIVQHVQLLGGGNATSEPPKQEAPAVSGEEGFADDIPF